MHIHDIRDKLNSSEYKFLREHRDLGSNIILLTLGGSYAYGTNVETSDLDIRGVALNKPEELLGLSHFEQFTDEATDTTIYSLKKIVTLLLNCNPNTIEILGTKPEHIFTISEEGKLLRDNIDLFLSQKCIHSFGGYATAQLRRLQNALARDSYPQAEKEKHILGSIKNQMYHLKSNYKTFTDENIRLYMDTSNRPDFEEEIFMDIQLTHYPLRDFKDIYSEMHNVVKDYNKLNHRNNKKTEKKLFKHAMHLIRLYLMLIDILEGKGINTYREKDRGLLMGIRNGSYTYSQIFEMVDDFEKQIEYARVHTTLPEDYDFKKVEELVMAINELSLKKVRK
ncbi:DNA polymerase beta superfamily protein [Vallitalea okinawensis]|uniref:DNA polymerase beta superfamily protein n=1 Tax=Vallitalea okinawensis TaxID=2078660 RepID=UPI000CFC28E5|nr:nucleotidyltransferase domain-containing protein [Vallitalea okinawensis]